jgi:hypothetical protein
MSKTPQSREQQIAAIEKDWADNPRWKGVKRGYSAADVVRLRGSMHIEHTLAQRGAEKLWDKINGGSKKGYVNAFGAISAGQAIFLCFFDLCFLEPVLIHPNLPFLVPYPCLRRRFSRLADWCFFSETMRPDLFCIKWSFFNPPEVLYAVPCQTWARVPIRTINFLPWMW